MSHASFNSGSQQECNGNHAKKQKTNTHHTQGEDSGYPGFTPSSSSSNKRTVLETPLIRHELSPLAQTWNSVWKLKSGNPTNLQGIKSDIEGATKIKFTDQTCYLYPAFKKALTTLIDDIEESLRNGIEGIIIIHGATGIGKSMLARSLAHYLSLTGEEVFYTKFGHSHTKFGHSHSESKEDITDVVVRCMQSKWVILDQCNVDKIDEVKVDHILVERMEKYQTPVLMFTSGHYAPDKRWNGVNDCTVELKVIDMNVDLATLDAMRTRMVRRACRTEQISNEDLLKLTSNYGRLMKCVSVLSRSPECSIEELETIVYGIQDCDFLVREENVHVAYTTWPNFEGGVPQQIELEKMIDRKLPTNVVEYFGQVASRGNKPRDGQDVRNMFSVMDIRGDTVDESDGYHQYNVSSYHYVFPHIRSIHGILRRVWCMYDPFEAYDACLKTFKRLQHTDQTDDDRSILAKLFTVLVQLSCDIRKSGADTYGVETRERNSEAEFVNVKFSKQASSVDSLFEIMREATKTNEPTEFNIWCQLKADFPGYDFALFTVQNMKVNRCQLFQASVNPEGKSHKDKTTMVKILWDIRDNLKDVIEDPDCVEPYFLCPHTIPIYVKEIEMSGTGIHAYSVCFPKMRKRIR